MRERNTPREILIFGAGNIGRSFVGQIFGRAGYAPVFADVDRELVAALNRDGRYTVVHRHPTGEEQPLEVPGVRAIDAGDADAVRRQLERSPIVATSVGAAVLPRLLPAITAEAVRRITDGLAPFDLVLAENIHGAGEMVRSAMAEAFHDAGATAPSSWYEGSVPRHGAPGVVECSVGKMVPIVPDELRRQAPTTVYAEAFNTLLVDRDGWANPVPAVPELRPVAPIAAWVDRKLYIHNLGHAAAAYLGHAADPAATYIWQVVDVPEVRAAVRAAMEVSGAALRREYPGVFTEDDIAGHIDDLLHRFSSRLLGDTVFRVGRDLERKLSPGDRVVGALRLAQRHGLDTTPIEAVYRAALQFRATDPTGQPLPSDTRLLSRIDGSDTPTVVAELSDLDPRIDAELISRLTR